MESKEKLERIPGHTLPCFTLKPGDYVSIGEHRVMLKRVRGSEVRLIVSAPEDVLVRLHKSDKLKKQGA